MILESDFSPTSGLLGFADLYPKDGTVHPMKPAALYSGNFTFSPAIYIYFYDFLALILYLLFCFCVCVWLKLGSHRSAFIKLKGACSLIILLSVL